MRGQQNIKIKINITQSGPRPPSGQPGLGKFYWLPPPPPKLSALFFENSRVERKCNSEKND